MEGSGIPLELISRPLLSFVNSFLFKQASKQQLSVQHLTKLCSYKSCYSAFGPVTTVLQWCVCFLQHVTNLCCCKETFCVSTHSFRCRLQLRCRHLWRHCITGLQTTSFNIS